MPKKKVHIVLPSDIWRAARAKALLQGTNVSCVVEDALRAWLQGKPVGAIVDWHTRWAHHYVVEHLLRHQPHAMELNALVADVTTRERPRDVVASDINALIDAGVVRVERRLGVDMVVLVEPGSEVGEKSLAGHAGTSPAGGV